MDLDVKKSEIFKLEEKTRLKEEALLNSQNTLEEDTTRFETFLKTTDDRAHSAIKHAEELNKKRLERVQKLKQLKSTIAGLPDRLCFWIYLPNAVFIF
jgi:hypothetical protein